MNDKFHLNRFLVAQDCIYDSVISELKSGEKHGHWMWYIFPQINGLGSTEMPMQFAISSDEEALAYLDHPILGERLKQCAEIVLNINERTAEQIFRYPDALKFCSCMTLFDVVSGDNELFQQAINKFFDGVSDQRTFFYFKK